MTKIVLADGSEEEVSPGEARARVAAGEATYYVTASMASAQSMSSQRYKTRQLVAEKPKKKRKRRTKAEIEADEAAAAEAKECSADESA